MLSSFMSEESAQGPAATLPLLQWRRGVCTPGHQAPAASALLPGALGFTLNCADFTKDPGASL